MVESTSFDDDIDVDEGATSDVSPAQAPARQEVRMTIASVLRSIMTILLGQPACVVRSACEACFPPSPPIV
jgi:hypothetical protein